ncbi:MAG TPA: metallophosphoesterase [Kiritimatiellia bacterium]|nr:metallophosphoesterase [Kiritimatiellia bacterium]
MKVAVISDIHANLPAMTAVSQHIESVKPDCVVVAGDVINRGPQPLECLEWVLNNVNEKGWRILKGNHEDYVLHASHGTSHLQEWEQKLCAHSLWTANIIHEYIHTIASWPDHVDIFAPDHSRLTCFHASRRGNRAGLYEFMQDHELLEHLGSAPPAVCVGHTHIPFIRYLSENLVVNSGAVGMPFDHIPDASYAVLQWSPSGWTAEIIRVPYDRKRTEEAYHSTGYLEQGGPMVPLILKELRDAAPRLGVWHRRYEKDVSTGRISVEESVDIMIKDTLLV